MANDLFPVRSIQIRTAKAGQPAKAEGQVFIELKPAPDQPAPGQPGKEAGDVTLMPTAGGFTAVVSLGKPDKITTDTYRSAGGKLAKWLKKNGVSGAQLDITPFHSCGVSNALVAFIEGLYLGSFQFTRYKSANQADKMVSVELTNTDEGVDSLLARSDEITAAVDLARAWAHEPANVINPVSLAERVQQAAAGLPLKVTVLDDQKLEEMNAGGIFSVGKGSNSGPRMIVIEYEGTGAKAGAQPVVLVGKAITFDTGGYSLKGVENIQGMKYDKCGGMVVAAVMIAAARAGLAIPVVGIICAAENMVSDHAYRPDDILTTLSGKTVEIITTDAEGRLVLADGLTYAQQTFTPKVIIDLATLTGGIVTALGRVRAGIFSNNDEFARQLIDIGERVHERLWLMPMDEDYFQNIKGDDADLKNSGGREGHPIMGAIFLKQFVRDDIPWAHLDIAGVADTNKELAYSPKGATGFGVRLLMEYLNSLS